jgi:hypothetical protein
MPIYLEPRDVTADLEDFNSVLIVSCPICPPMSMAMQTKKPFIDLFKHGIKTEAFEDYIKSIEEPLKEHGIHTDVFTTRAPSPMMCLWTEGQRSRLLKRARDYEAVLVVGCNSAIHVVKDILKGTDCKVFSSMQMKAIANATMKFQFPLKVIFDMNPLKKKSRVRNQEGTAKTEKGKQKEIS